jgi:hypothetical protein
MRVYTYVCTHYTFHFQYAGLSWVLWEEILQLLNVQDSLNFPNTNPPEETEDGVLSVVCGGTLVKHLVCSKSPKKYSWSYNTLQDKLFEILQLCLQNRSIKNGVGLTYFQWNSIIWFKEMTVLSHNTVLSRERTSSVVTVFMNVTQSPKAECHFYMHMQNDKCHPGMCFTKGQPCLGPAQCKAYKA